MLCTNLGRIVDLMGGKDEPETTRKMDFADFLSVTQDMLEQHWGTIRSRMEVATRTEWALLVFSVLAGYLLLYMFIHVTFMDNTPLEVDDVKGVEEEEEKEPPRDFTLEQLRECNGTNGKPIHIALRREVYDVSSAPDFYGPEGSYSCFAGREASRAMAKLSFDEAELDNLNLMDISPFERESLEGWIDKFKYYRDYPIVGKVTVPPKDLTFTIEELSKYNGKQETTSVEGEDAEHRLDKPIYVSLNKNVYDVSYGGKEMYAEGGPYFLFAGKDVSRALAKMSFKPEDVESLDVSDLTTEQKKTLQEWETKFSVTRKYPCVGKLVY